MLNTSRIKKGAYFIALPIAICASEAVSRWWTNPAEPPEGRWVLSYSFPVDSPRAEKRPVRPRIVELLNCSEGLKGRIHASNSRWIEVSYFEWNDVAGKGLKDAFDHQPEICMEAIGKQIEAYLPERKANVGGRLLVFDATQFSDDEGRPLYIFKLSWAEGLDGFNLLRRGPSSPEASEFKLRSAWNRWFPKHARVLMLGVNGADNDQEAWDLVSDQILSNLAFTKTAD